MCPFPGEISSLIVRTAPNKALQCDPDACNIGCKHWRSAILSEAKFGWCVRGLEEIAQKSTRQQVFIFETWVLKLHKMPVADDGSAGTCSICYPNKTPHGNSNLGIYTKSCFFGLPIVIWAKYVASKES